MVLSLIVGAAVVGLAYAVAHTTKLRSALKHHTIATHVSRGVSVFMLGAQASELVRLVEHVSFVGIVASLLLLVIVIATKSGTEGELH